MDVLWIVAAFAAGFVARQLKLPTLVGYLIAGIVLSLAGVQSSSLIGAIADFGVVLLLFTVGLHIRIKNLLQVEVFGVGLIHMLISSVIFMIVLLVGGIAPFPAILAGIGLSFSSTVLTAKSLDSRNELDTYHGRIAIGVLVLQDIVAVVLLIFTGADVPTPWAILLLGLPLLRPALLWLMRHSGREEVLILFGLFLAIGVGYLFELVGLDGKLGALVAGLILAGAEEADELYDMLWGLKEVFLVGFFLEIGLSGLPSLSALPIVLVLLTLLPLKAVLFFALFILFRLRARTAFLSTVALTAYSEFALIVTSEAADAGLVDASLVSVVGLLVILSFIINAPLSRYVNQLVEPLGATPCPIRTTHYRPSRSGPALAGLIGLCHCRAWDWPDRPPMITCAPADPALWGWTPTRRRLPTTSLSDAGCFMAMPMTGSCGPTLDLSRVEGVILTVPNAEAMAATARNLRQEGYSGPISALLRSSENRDKLEAAGVTTMLMPMEQAGRDLAQACLVNPV